MIQNALKNQNEELNSRDQTDSDSAKAKSSLEHEALREVLKNNGLKGFEELLKENPEKVNEIICYYMQLKNQIDVSF